MVTRWNIRTTGFFAVRVAVSYFSRNHQVVRLVDIPFLECLRAHASIRIAQSCIHSLKYQSRFYVLGDVKVMIAKSLNDATMAKDLQNLLVRKAYTQTQTRLSRNTCHQNVKNAFALASDAVVIPNQTYILVDDVITTRSTFNACAAALRETTAIQIKVPTLGHG